MKNLILTLTLLVSTLTSFSQTITIEFDKFNKFNCGNKTTYKEIIDSNNYLDVVKSIDSPNEYKIDLTNKTMSLYSNGVLFKKTSIIEYTKKGDLLTMTINDKEMLTGKHVISTVVINTDNNNKKDPYFLMYFTSTLDNTTNGVICMK